MHPVNKLDFGTTGIAVSYYSIAAGANVVGYVVKQTGTSQYIVNDGVHAVDQTITLAQTPAQVAALGSTEPSIGTILITPTTGEPEHVRILFDTTAETVEKNRYTWTKGASMNGSAVIATF
jgi:hypothetical protein